MWEHFSTIEKFPVNFLIHWSSRTPLWFLYILNDFLYFRQQSSLQRLNFIFITEISSIRVIMSRSNFRWIHSHSPEELEIFWTNSWILSKTFRISVNEKVFPPLHFRPQYFHLLSDTFQKAFGNCQFSRSDTVTSPKQMHFSFDKRVWVEIHFSTTIEREVSSIWVKRIALKFTNCRISTILQSSEIQRKTLTKFTKT